MNDNYKPVSLGRVELSNIGEEFLAEMSPGNVDFSNRIGFCDIQVWPNEGPIPHFHIIPIDPKVAKNWQCCICLYEAKYFNHGSKQGTLTNKQLKILDKWLRDELTIRNSTNSKWEWACIFWEVQNNPTTNVPRSNIIEQPDYTKITRYK